MADVVRKLRGEYIGIGNGRKIRHIYIKINK